MDIDTLKTNLLSVAQLLGKEIPSSAIEIVDRGVPHQPATLPKDKMAVYIFCHNDVCLKIGKVGAGSNPRFKYQHYSPTSNGSTLAKSILSDIDYCNLENIEEHEIKNWMLNNLQRIDILIDEKLGVFTRDFFEVCLHYQYEPKYEGFKSQR